MYSQLSKFNIEEYLETLKYEDKSFFFTKNSSRRQPNEVFTSKSQPFLANDNYNTIFIKDNLSSLLQEKNTLPYDFILDYTSDNHKCQVIYYF